MSTSEGLGGSDPILGDLGSSAPESIFASSEVPPVVAVLVTTDPGPDFEAVLSALGAQDYPALTVLVVDAGSEFDLTPRVGARLPTAIVRRLGGKARTAEAVNEAIGAVDGASFYLVVSDDVVLDPSALRIMVEEAYRSNAGIVGPKLVNPGKDGEPNTLLEVGRSIDRFGGSHTGIEPNEIDQEQHDNVRDVFFVSSSVFLVRADLFSALHGLDPETSPGSEDLDLCWRSWLIGARVVIAPDAVGVVEQSPQTIKGGGEKEKSTKANRDELRSLARARLRVVMTCYSRLTLLWLIPLGLFGSSIQALVLLPTANRHVAASEFRSWWWSLIHFRRLRVARKSVQSSRVIKDSDLHELQVGLRSRFDSFVEHNQADERLESVGDRVGSFFDQVSDGLRTPAVMALISLLVIFIFGSRDLLTQGVPAVGSFSPWPGIQAMLAEFSSSWRHTGLGSGAFASPVLVVTSTITAVLFGASGLAQTLVVVGSALLGAFGVYRLMRIVAAGVPAAITAAIVYAIIPVWRNGVAGGRLGALVLYSLLPFMVVLLIRAGGFDALTKRSRRPLLGLVLVTALATAWYPPAGLAGLLVAMSFLISAIFVGGFRASVRALMAAIVSVLAAALLLIPWTFNFADIGKTDKSFLGFSHQGEIDLLDILRFKTGPAGAGIASWGILLAALLALLVARGPRLAWATRAWFLAVVGFSVAWLPSILGMKMTTVIPEAGLILAALGIATAVGVSIDSLLGDYRDLGNQLSRPVARVAVLTIVILGVSLGSLGFLADSVSGRWGAPDKSWADTLAFTKDSPPAGQFRILWVGDPEVLPFEPFLSGDDFGWTMTRNGPGDFRQYLRAPETPTDRVVTRAINAAVSNDTARLGHLLAPSGIRYVALPSINGLGGTAGKPQPALTAALANQLDLARLRTENGLILYENQSWFPATAIIPEAYSSEVPLDAKAPLRSAVGSDVEQAQPLDDERPVPAGTVFLSEAFDSQWQAQANGETLDHEKAFSEFNGWVNKSRTSVAISHKGQTQRYLLIAAEAFLWLLAIGWWFRSRDKRSHSEPNQPTLRPERSKRFAASPADDDLEGFWGES